MAHLHNCRLALEGALAEGVVVVGDVPPADDLHPELVGGGLELVLALDALGLALVQKEEAGGVLARRRKFHRILFSEKSFIYSYKIVYVCNLHLRVIS
jgi:hypothetical protein